MKRLPLILSLASLLLCGGFLIDESKCDGDAFDGEVRKEAKLSIGTGSVEPMSVVEFLKTFSGKPGLDDDSPRSPVEQRNVTITAWLYTYAREGDEDFHLVIGSTNKSAGRKFMTAEVSGLPKSSSQYYQDLKKARDQFKSVILKGENYCSSFTKKYLKKPIKVTITGSVFYDTHHANGGSGTGKYKAKSAWEIHPITSIKPAE
jgi:hypothetical protein